MSALDELSLRAPIAEAAESGATVTVTRADGKSATGVIQDHPTDPDLYKVATGRRGRPFVFHPDDVDEVSFE